MGLAAALGGAGLPEAALAHVSEQGFVLLLPTEIYIAAGVATVAATVLLIALLPAKSHARLFRPLRLFRFVPARLPLGTSCIATALLLALLLIGKSGITDPLENLLPLTVWTVWWVALVSLQGLFGDLWRWINPWTGPLTILRRALPLSRLRLPRAIGGFPAVAGLLAFAGFYLADPAPADPSRLSGIVFAYWLANLVGALTFGPRWLLQCEALTVMMRAYRRVALFGRRGRHLSAGLWGWRVAAGPAPPISVAVFCLLLLGIGSFDGLNETFWWFALVGINPLEFPGRSAVIAETLTGLIAANLALTAVFALCVGAGLLLARTDLSVRRAFTAFAPALLPIALGYHIAHYLPTFLVDIQWVYAALSDPLGRGADLLGIGEFYVTTGFFNTLGTVRIIWLSQAAAVVIGHLVSILLAHAIALRETGSARAATISQAPLAAFMIGYTLFGLWLLASPRGV